MSKPKLVYFDFRGRAELTRLTLALAGQDFDDVRFGREDWPKYKPESPFGQAPYAEINGQKYAQSNALATYFAREYGLYGKTNLDALRIDEVLGLGSDMWQAVIKVFQEADETKKAELDKKLMTEDFPKLFGFFRDLLKKNDKGVFVGSDLTLADLCAFDMMFNMNKVKKYDAAASYPELKALADKVEANPNIKAYLAKRKDTDF